MCVIADAIENGEKKVEDIVRKAAYLEIRCVAIANYLYVLSPELVILVEAL